MRFREISYILVFCGLGLGTGLPAASAQKNKKVPVAEPSQAVTKQQIEAEFIEAMQEKLIGNTKISLTLFGAFTKKHPEVAAGHFEFAELSVVNGIYSQALPAYQRAVELEPKNKWYKVRLAELYDFLKMYRESKEVYKKLAEMYPADLEYSLSAAAIMVQEGKLGEAVELLDNIEKQIGVTPDLNLEKYRLYMGQKKYPEALKELEKLQARYPNETLYWGMSAEVYQARGESKKALEAYQKILQTDSNNTLIHLAIADYYQKEKDLGNAFRHLEKAFANPGVDVDKKVMILLSFLDQSKNSELHRQEGEKLTRLLTQVHPENAKSWSITGDYCLEQKNWRGAMEAFMKSAELEPSKFIFFRQTAQLASRVEDNAVLSKIAASAEELFPMQPEVYLYKGLALMQAGKTAEAEEALNYGKELVIENPLLGSDFLAALGKLSALKKAPAQAYEYFDKAITTAPENYWAHLQYAKALANAGQNDKAKSMADKSIALTPNFPEAYAVKAQALLQSNDLKGATENIEKSIQNGGKQIKSVLMLYADITEKNGNTAKAAQIRAEANAI